MRFHTSFMNGVFSFQTAGEPSSVTSAQLQDFAAHIGLERVCPNRYSYLLALDIFIEFHHGTLSPEEVVREIGFLETDPNKSRTKPAEQFERKPLQGLWHKHYFTAAHVAQNLLNQLAGKKGLMRMLNRICPPDRREVFTEEMADETTFSTTQGPIFERLNANELTGEWIVFTKHGGGNYYLCLAKHTKHSDDDNRLLARITDCCLEQFPFLSDRQI